MRLIDQLMNQRAVTTFEAEEAVEGVCVARTRGVPRGRRRRLREPDGPVEDHLPRYRMHNDIEALVYGGGSSSHGRPDRLIVAFEPHALDGLTLADCHLGGRSIFAHRRDEKGLERDGVIFNMREQD